MALCVTGKGLAKEKLLGDVPMPKGSGLNMATAVIQLFREWNIPLDHLIAVDFDTTATCTGPMNGDS